MEIQNVQERKYLYSHTSEETAYVVKDYPWGFRLRTTIRYWIESKRAKNGGQRFCRQTINPKNGKWCAPKYSTYSPIMIMFLDENEHIKFTGLDHNSGKERIEKFKEKHLANLTEFQKEQLADIMAYDEVMQHVTFSITQSEFGSVELFSNDPAEKAKLKLMLAESEEAEKRKQESLSQISRAIAYQRAQISL